MPTHALLGATGSTGSAIIRSLLSQPPKDLTLNIFVRSKAKLDKAFPDIQSTTAFIANIIEGVMSDATAVQKCLENVDVVFACIGTNEASRDMTIAIDTASAIVDALELQREARGPAYRTPTILQLRSMTLNPVLSQEQPWLVHQMASFCFYYIYADLARACELYESSAVKSPGLLKYIYVDPPSIHDPDGTTPTGHKLYLQGEKNDGALMYADLGAAFCEVAQRRDEFAGKGVGVAPTGPVNQTWGSLRPFIFQGLKTRIWG